MMAAPNRSASLNLPGRTLGPRCLLFLSSYQSKEMMKKKRNLFRCQTTAATTRRCPELRRRGAGSGKDRRRLLLPSLRQSLRGRVRRRASAAAPRARETRWSGPVDSGTS